MPPNPRRTRRLRKWAGKRAFGIGFAVVISLMGALFWFALDSSRPHVEGDALRLDVFVDAVLEGDVQTATLLDVDAYVIGRYRLADGSTGRYNTPYLKIALPDLVDLLLDNDVPVTVDQQNGKRVTLLGATLLPFMILVLLFIYLIRSFRRGTGLFAVRSGAVKARPDQQKKVTFAHVAGQHQAVMELREIVQFLKHPERFRSLGAVVPKGVLLYGPPGCGKTLLARALAGESGANFYSISGSDFVELYVGVGAARVRDLFREARENAPSLIFIDELDSIGRTRAGGGAERSGSEQEQALNQILAEMDGFSLLDNVIVVGATNRPDILDQALLRPGRFDRAIGLERPDEDARLAILELHGRKKKLSSDIDLAAMARKAIGLTGADLALLLNEAALRAGRAGDREITQAHLDQALGRILAEPDRQRRLSLRDRGIGRRFSSEERVTFEDVAGIDDAIEELEDIRTFLAAPERFVRLGARVPKGILLAGPPGCGKTLVARALAGETNAAFFTVSGSEFVQTFVGEGAARVRDLFAESRAAAPAILFIDEIDAVGGQRGGLGTGADREYEQTLNQFLVEMDGFDAGAGVIVMAATNRPDMLDPALIRPGRFDRRVTIDLPDRKGRAAILSLHARGKRLAPGVEIERIAEITPGLSGADLANVMNEAALLAMRLEATEITAGTIDEAIERALLGVSSRKKVMTEEDKRRVAYHEAGHALAALMLPGGDPPHKITIVPRGLLLGYVWQPPGSERLLRTRSELIDKMAVGLAGRAAEQLVFGELGDGAAGDLMGVTDIAVRMVCELGMGGEVGPVLLTEGTRPDGTQRRPWSDETQHLIDREVRALITEAQDRAHQLLSSRRSDLDNVAVRLIEQESLTSAELAHIVAPVTPLRRPGPVAEREGGGSAQSRSHRGDPTLRRSAGPRAPSEDRGGERG